VSYDPDKHHRRSIRLKGYDYAQPGAYFCTIVTHQRELLFDDPVLRRIVETMWQHIPRHAPHVSLDEWCVMPNHVHGILVITERSRRGDAFPVNRSDSRGSTFIGTLPVDTAGSSECIAPTGTSPGSLGAIVGNFKSVAARRINRVRKTPGASVWQRNYYERVIRNERELDAIRQYIVDNPLHWESDPEHPGA
jgi:REP element-mobilizing transposase RayT